LSRRDEAYHPPIFDSFPQVLQDVLKACWKPLPADRPSFKEIIKMLEANKKAKATTGNQEYDVSSEPNQTSAQSLTYARTPINSNTTFDGSDQGHVSEESSAK